MVESGGELPAGAIDFGPTVRFYGDQYFGVSPSLERFVRDGVEPERSLVQGWRGTEGFVDTLLAPLAAGGSVVVVAGLASTARLEEIARAENVTRRLG